MCLFDESFIWPPRYHKLFRNWDRDWLDCCQATRKHFSEQSCFAEQRRSHLICVGLHVATGQPLCISYMSPCVPLYRATGEMSSQSLGWRVCDSDELMLMIVRAN